MGECTIYLVVMRKVGWNIVRRLLRLRRFKVPAERLKPGHLWPHTEEPNMTWKDLRDLWPLSDQGPKGFMTQGLYDPRSLALYITTSTTVRSHLSSTLINIFMYWELAQPQLGINHNKPTGFSCFVHGFCPLCRWTRALLPNSFTIL